MGPGAMIFVFEKLSFKPVFYSPLLPSARGFLVPLHFLPLEWYHLHIWGYWYFSQHSWFPLVFHPVWHFTWCTLQTCSNTCRSGRPSLVTRLQPLPAPPNHLSWLPSLPCFCFSARFFCHLAYYNVLICLLFDFLQQNISSIMAEVFNLFLPTADSWFFRSVSRINQTVIRYLLQSLVLCLVLSK